MGGGTGEGFPLGAVLPSLVPWAGGGGSSLVSLLLPQTPLAPLCQHGGAVVCLNGWVLASARSQSSFSFPAAAVPWQVVAVQLGRLAHSRRGGCAGVPEDPVFCLVTGGVLTSSSCFQ